MWPSTQDWVSALYIIIPIYCTNGAPVLFGGGKPIDFGRNLADGERIFGDHKTVRGFLSGLLVGVLVGCVASVFVGLSVFEIAVVASAGALLGDLSGAFVKRRLGIKPGQPLPIVDQLDFVLGAVIAVSLISVPTLGALLILLCVTPPIHLFTNVCAYRLGLKSTYW